MTKFKKSIFIFGILALIIGVALGTFIVLSLTGSLKDEPIEIEFTVNDIEKTYDGEPLVANSYMITGGYLIEGHRPVASFTGSQTEVGQSYSGLDIKIVDEKDYDVSKEYKIKVNSGILSVNYCGLRITLSAQDVIYDGNIIDIGNGYSVSGGKLAFGHRVSVQIKDEWFANAGKIVADKTLTAVDVIPLIVDANGRNATSNYMITLAGKINVVKRPLALVPVSAEKTYDGRALECSQYKILSGSLAAGHYIQPEYQSVSGGPARVVDANEGNPLQVILNAKIYDINNDDVTDNYAIASGIGMLTVNKASLTIVAKSESWTYDGTKHSLENDTSAGSVVGLARGDSVTVQYSGTVTDVSVVANKIEKYLINGVEGNGNYIVTCVDGKLEVTKAHLTVTWNSLEKEYDGTPFTAKSDEPYILLSSMTGITLQFSEEKLNELLVGITTPGISTYTYNNFTVLNGKGEDITEMFNITVLPGNLTITRRNVTVTANNLSKTYDGNLIFTDGISIDRLVKGHTLTSVNLTALDKNYTAGSQFNAGIKEITLVDTQGNSVGGYYNITNFDISINVTVNQRELQVSTNSVQKVYDGTPLNGGILNYSRLATGDSMSYTSLEITNVSEKRENSPEFKILNSEGNEVTEFYKINKTYGTLEILQKPVTVYFDEIFELEYKEEGISGSSLKKYIKCNELDPDNFNCEDENFSEIGLQPVTFEWDSNDTVMKENHTIVQGNNRFRIVKQKATASIQKDVSVKIYNNKYLTEKEILAIASAEEGAQYISSNLSDKIDVGTYSAEIVYETAYYHYTVTGDYFIEPMPIKIAYDSGSEDKICSKLYDGKAFEPNLGSFTVESDLEESLSVKSFIKANEIFKYSAESQPQKFSSFEIVFAKTGESVKPGNVEFDVSQFSVDVQVKRRQLIVTLDPVYGSVTTNQILVGLINIYNLADGDEVDFGDWYDWMGTAYPTGSNTFAIDLYLIKIWRGEEDVTNNYLIPDSVNGTIIPN